MNRGDIKSLCYTSTAGAKPAIISEITANAILKLAALDIATHGVILPVNQKFAAVAFSGFGAASYDMSTLVTGYLVPNRQGLWWNSGTVSVPAWKEVLPKTKEWMDEYMRNWRDQSAGDPQYWWMEGNTLKVWPGPESALTDGFDFHYGRTPYEVTDDAQYYFFGTTEMANYDILVDAMISYFKWRTLGALGKEDNYLIAKKTYEADRDEKIRLLNRNLAVNQSRYARYQPAGKRLGTGGFRR